MLKTITTLAAATFITAAVAGCQDHADRVTGPGVEATDYPATHFNPAVNSSGSMVGRDNPTVNPQKESASGTGTPNTGKMLNGSGGNGQTVGTPSGGGMGGM